MMIMCNLKKKNIFPLKNVPKISTSTSRSLWLPLPRVPKMLIYEETQYVIDRLDEVCRLAFPLSYLLIQLSYFSYYFYIAQDK